MNTDAANLYQCEYRLSDSEQRLLSLAQQYVVEAEAYDRTVCTGPIQHDGIVPATHHEFALVNRNARQLLDRLCGEHPGFTRQQIRQAISRIDKRGPVL